MSIFSYIRDFFGFDVLPEKRQLPGWAYKNDNVIVIDAEKAFPDYFQRLGYPYDGFSARHVGIARRCMLRDITEIVAEPGITFKLINSGRFNPDALPKGEFIDWNREYARISKKS